MILKAFLCVDCVLVILWMSIMILEALDVVHASEEVICKITVILLALIWIGGAISCLTLVFNLLK